MSHRIIILVALVLAYPFLLEPPPAVRGQTPAQESLSRDGTYLLSFQPEQSAVVVEVGSRAKIKKSLFVDLVGLRLWVDSPEAVKRLKSQLANPAAAYRLALVTLAQKLRETGIEPDMSPVVGEAGKQKGAQGMVFLEGGEFQRTGQFYDSSGGGLTILPDGSVRVSRGDKYRVRVSSFFIDKFKVTNEAYCQFLNDGNEAYWTPWNTCIVRSPVSWPASAGKFIPASRAIANHPVGSVNWYQARGYAAWAGKRLPTEAEWEYAATGKEGRKFPWGNEPPDETRANYPVKYRHTLPVDWYPRGATPEGVMQMAGNGAEWCSDYFDYRSYVKAPAEGVAVDPKGAAQGFQPNEWYKFNVAMKGWCKPKYPEHLTCSKRHGRHPLVEDPEGIGIRCVKSAAAKPTP